MTCPAPETFSAFVSGSLAAAARDALEVHVDACASCRITLSELGRRAAAPADRARLPAIGERVGRYAITGELGAGAMGVVYRARDPELDREVAIKLVQPQAGSAEDELVQQRMLREGRVLARIDHPNVVRVFDVGRWHGAVFVAMEHAAGVSLRAWLAAAPRGVRAIVDVFVQCAHGLAAAHAAGVIHRDFKPDNVVVDDRGRARVMDFGLAQTEPDAVATRPALAAGSADADLRLTRTRGVVGTPAYMAPEQHRGAAIDARADQFAWCVALAEALGGARPFTGETHAALLAAIDAGAPALAPAIPRRIRRVLARGLASEPAQRFPTMLAAAAALAPQRRWPRAAAAAAVIAIAVAAVVVARGGGRGDPCADVASPLARTWHPARAARIGELFAAAQRPFAARAWAYARAGVDSYARAWTAARIGVCRAGVERGELDAATRARTVHCLDRRLLDLDAALARWETGGVDALAAAPQLVDGLAPVARCATSEHAPPPSEAERVRVRAFEARFAAARVAADSGKPLEAEPRLRELERELAATPYHGLRAEVLTRLAGAQRDLGKRDDARGHLIAALTAAETARADRARARAWIALAQLATEDFAQVTEARDALRLASAVLAHLDDADDLARLHDATRGLVALRASEPAEAVAALRRSLDDAALPATERATRTQMLARALIAAGAPGDALVELERAEALLVAALGPDAPQLVFVLNSSMEPLAYLGRAKDAIARGERALALLDASYGADNPRRTQLLGNLASMYASAGDPARARELEEEVVRATERQLGPDAHATATARLNLGSTLTDLGEPARAIEHLERARAIYAKLLGPDAPVIANVHTALYAAHAALAHPADALAHAQRALAIREAAAVPPGYLAYTRFVVAQALAAAGQRAEGIAMARRALELPLGATGREAELARDIRAWLAARTRR